MRGQQVYVDVLILLNFIVDYFLILSMQLLCHRKPHRQRILLAAAVGSLFSLTLFLPVFSRTAELLCKLLSCALMVRIADRWGGWRRFFHGCAALFGVTFLYGGAMLMLRLSLGPGRLLCANGVVYFHLSPLVLVLNITLGFVLMYLLRRFLFEHSPQPLVYDVTLKLFDKTISCRGLVDSGNHLREPFSGYPVLIVGYETLCPALPPPLQGLLRDGELFSDMEKLPAMGVRLIPYQGVENGGVLAAVQGERLLLRRGDTELEIEQFYVAISRDPIGTGQYQMLLSGEMMDTKRERSGVMLCCEK